MGTAFAVTIEDEVDPEVVEQVFDWWADVERRFSTFIPESQISAIGRGALDRSDADPDVRHVLAMCDELQEVTEGRFTITPPGGDGIDPAGYVKGWSVDEAALILKGAGIRNFCIYAGGDVLCAGRPSDAETWSVGVRLPQRPDAIGAAISINDGAVASSGEYRRGTHIWGVGDGPRHITGATVVGRTLGMADALATAVFADQGRSFQWMAAYPDYAVVLFTADGRIRWSPSLQGRIHVGGASAPPGDE